MGRINNKDTFIGSVHIGDPCCSQTKVDCFVEGAVNACNFMNGFPLLDFYFRDKIAQNILKAAKVGEKGAILIIKAQPVYHPGEDDFIDYEGNRLVLERFYMMLKMESSMWILSTLGGGFSALADCGLKQFAESALSVSKKQLKLAEAIGDEILLARCHIYIGFAMAQLGQFEQAFQTLQYCRKVAKDLKCSLLEDLTAALYMKIKYLDTNRQIVGCQKFVELYDTYERNFN